MMTTRIGAALGALLLSTPALAEQNLIDLARKVEVQVEEIYGFKAKKPIRFEIASREHVRKFVEKSSREQYKPGEIEREGLALRALGLIPPDLDYPSFLLALLEEQVGGYYDPKTEVFYLADWISPAFQESIIAHELVHALQDQHYDLDKFVERVPGNSDFMLARASLAEGEATQVMMAHTLKKSGLSLDVGAAALNSKMAETMIKASSAQFPTFAKAPAFLQAMLMFPYLKGMAFVTKLHSAGGLKQLGKVYKDLPASTEQILHPEKYYASRDVPVPMDLGFTAKALPASAEQIFEDVLGEFGVVELLHPLRDQSAQERAGAGWGGDRYRVYKRKDGSLAFLFWSAWDTESDAIEFASAFALTVTQRRPGAVLSPPAEQQMVWVGPGQIATLVRRAGLRVLVVDGFTAEEAARLSAAAR